jgi:alpha-beta hydrolase superfamily lysophospholipase
MNSEFVRFKATDDTELVGWLSDPGGDTAVIHIHGMSGNGYENNFLDTLRQYYFDNGIAFFSIDTRGRGIISDFRRRNDWLRGGSCFEVFEDSIYDIEGAIRHLQSYVLQKKRIILEGHSLGCTKVVNFWLTKEADEVSEIILIAPTDMAGWAKVDPEHQTYLQTAKQLLSEGNTQALVSAQAWIDKTPISAQTYPTICEEGSSADMYGEREDGALLGRVSVPMLIIYGTEDIGIVEIDGTVEKWEARVNNIKHPHTQVSIVTGANHGFIDYENELVASIDSFLTIAS